MRYRWQISGHKHERLILRPLFLLWSCPTSLTNGDASCGGEFRTTFRTIPAPVAQWIEQRFPKPQVACSIHAGGTTRESVRPCQRSCVPEYRSVRALHLAVDT